MSSLPAGSLFLHQSPYFELRMTTHGGRSLFATCDIAPGTRIHSSEAPFAHVIYRDYRKEVCAQCFAYSASDHAPPTVGPSRTWSIKWNQAGATARFCSAACKESWVRDEASALMVAVDALLTKGQGATRRRFESLEEEAKIKAMLPFFDSGDTPVSQGTIDTAWEGAEALIASRTHSARYCSTLRLEDMELEIARLLAAVIVRRHCDETRFPSDPISQTMRDRSGSWVQLLDLQSSELWNIRTRPYMLAAHLRIYIFLSNVLPKYLQKHMPAVRDVLARDTGNAFGIWDGDRRDEMLGWGMWVSASYFNHSAFVAVHRNKRDLDGWLAGCAPNVSKRREGRALHFEVTQRIEAGEELCTSYIDVDAPVAQRRRELETSWFFVCRCPRCEKESSL